MSSFTRRLNGMADLDHNEKLRKLRMTSQQKKGEFQKFIPDAGIKMKPYGDTISSGGGLQCISLVGNLMWNLLVH